MFAIINPKNDTMLFNIKKKIQKKLNLDNWKKLKISDYFYVFGTKTTKKEHILPGKFSYITTKNTSNGYENSSHIWTEEGNVISIDSATNGACFYQKKNFIASDHVEKIWPKNKKFNIYNALFLTTILNFENHKYSYGRGRNLENIKKEKIFLPFNQNKEIDWKYMQIYIHNLYKKIIKKFLNNL